MKNFGRRRDDYQNKLPASAFGRRRDDISFDQSPLLLAMVGLDFRLKLLNPAWERSLGYAGADMLGQTLRAFVDSAEHVALHRLLNPHLREDGVAIEFSLRCKDRSYRCFRWERRTALAEQSMLIVGTDITERKKREVSSSLLTHTKPGSGRGGP